MPGAKGAVGAIVRSGVVAGAAGGAMSAVLLLVMGEPVIGRAIAIEEAAAHTHEPLFSRAVQQIGGVTAAVIAGAAFGVVFGVVFAAVRHRLPGVDDRARGFVLAGAAFTVVYLVPWFKYPPNPPGVGDPDTLNERTILYLIAIAWGAAAVVAGHRCALWLHERSRSDAAPLAGCALFAGLVVAGLALLPASPDPVAAPANLVWQFRTASLAGAATLWATLAVTFGWLVQRASR